VAGDPVTYFRATDPFPLESADFTKLHEFYARLAGSGPPGRRDDRDQ